MSQCQDNAPLLSGSFLFSQGISFILSPVSLWSQDGCQQQQSSMISCLLWWWEEVVEEWNSACLSSCSRGDRSLLELCVVPAGVGPSLCPVETCCCSVGQSCLCDPWTAAHQASLSFANSWSLLKLISVESVMPSNHLILCYPLLLLPSIFPSIKVFSNELVLHIRWPKY